jgi:hypothetical protein
MSTTIFPESGDQITEAAWSAQNQSLTVAERYRLSGYTVSAGTGLNANVAAGTCVVNGYHIVSDGTQAVAVTASQTNYIWLNADGTLSANTTGTNPGSELLLGKAVTDGSGVTSVSHDFNIKNSLNVYIRKASDETVNNSSTLQNDDDFQFPIVSGEQWEIDLILSISDGNNPTYDIKAIWAGVTLTQHLFYYGKSGSSAVNGSASGELLLDLNTSASIIVLRSIIFATSTGTLAFQWAQNSATATNTTIKAGSLMIARRILG